MAAVTAERSAAWRSGQRLRVDHEMYRLATAIGSQVLYQDPIDDRTAAEIADAGLIVVRGIGKRVLAPFGLAERLPTPANRRYDAAVARLHRVVDRIVAARRAAGGDSGDLLSILLLSTTPDGGETMTDQQVHDEVATMLGGADRVDRSHPGRDDLRDLVPSNG